MLPAPPEGLYVHVPFCVSVCPYCDFVVVAGSETRGPANRIASFVDALGSAEGSSSGPTTSTAASAPVRPSTPDRGRTAARPSGSVYLGGGTPSLLSPDELTAILERIRVRFGLIPDAEVTLEANPGPDERGDPVGQRAAGVTRLSIGAQSFIPSELSRLGRRHTPGHVGETVAAAREAGIGSVGLDLLYDVPGQTIASLDGEPRVRPGPRTGPPLALRPRPRRPRCRGSDRPAGRPPPDEHRRPTLARPRASRAGRGSGGGDVSRRVPPAGRGRLPRATSSRTGPGPGHESRHNRLYWDRRPVEAVGPGAHAFDGVGPALERRPARRLPRGAPPGDSTRRRGPTMDGPRRGDRLRPSLPPGQEEPPLDRSSAAVEALILGLRTDDGVPLTAFLDASLAEATRPGPTRRTSSSRPRSGGSA